jgi:hypothetical protein
MRIFVLCAAAISVAGCDALTSKANVYKLPVARAYQKLMAVDIKPSGTGPFYRLDIQTTGKRNELVEWAIKGHNAPYCVASLKSLDAERTRVDLSCKRGEGAIAGMQAKLTRNRVIELVDATLKDRPFDSKSADLAAVAASWPEDPATKDANLGTAAAEALEMDRKMSEDIRRISAQRPR